MIEIQKMQQNTNAQLHNIVKEQQKMKLELEQREKELQKREARNDSERRKLMLEKEMVIIQDLSIFLYLLRV